MRYFSVFASPRTCVSFGLGFSLFILAGCSAGSAGFVAAKAGSSGVSATANPQVALYTYTPPASGIVRIDFGPTTAYGRSTAGVSGVSGNPVGIEVAGMLANTLYHMRATLVTSSGSTYQDSDQTFTTGSWGTASIPIVSATTSSGATPQPGIDLIDVSNTNYNYDLPLYATDLNGNVIWAYPKGQTDPLTILQGARLLPNGHFLIEESLASQDLLENPVPAETVDLIREIDLAGNSIQQLSATELNSRLAAAGFTGISIVDLHHEITVLPNGHILLIGSIFKTLSGLQGYTSPVQVFGDVIIDLDSSWNPVWVWNEFDHLDPNRHPISFPDWTHTNAVIYSKDDGNLIVSSRHQSWLIKVDYANGAGAGDILWKLGYQGDFTLTNGNSPQDWFYGQHGPSFVSSNTTGTFQLTMIDNGYGRFNSTGDQCTAQTGSALCYTTVPILTINEAARTATISWRDTLPSAQYSFWGGYTESLANGNLEFALSNEPNTTSDIYEVTTNSAQNIVWNLQVSNQSVYRAFRLPSLYPGVQW